jgi:hypothetical protein
MKKPLFLFNFNPKDMRTIKLGPLTIIGKDYFTYWHYAYVGLIWSNFEKALHYRTNKDDILIFRLPSFLGGKERIG